MHRSSGVAVLAVYLALAGLGCGGGSKAKPVKVEGVVLLDGNPLAGAMVRYSPLDANGEGAYGLTRDDGTFRLSCQSGAEGALPGQYKVVIAQADSQKTEAPADPKEAQRMADQMMRGMVGKVGQKKRATGPQRASTVPAVYSNENTTPLLQTVPPPEKVTLNLQSRKR